MSELGTISVRAATEEERADLLVLMHDELVSYTDVIMKALGITWAEFEALFASVGEVRTITADSEAAGYCWIEERGRDLHLHAIFVLPAYRSRGVGTTAIRLLEEEFRSLVDSIELGVRESNEGARSLYEREGFVAASARPEVGFVVMRKRLGGEPSN